jgi:hypothetical protein
MSLTDKKSKAKAKGIKDKLELNEKRIIFNELDSDEESQEIDFRRLGKGKTFWLEDNLNTPGSQSQEMLLFKTCPYSTEMILSEEAYEPIFGNERDGKEESESGYFIGRIENCPDRIESGEWEDSKPKDYMDFRMVEFEMDELTGDLGLKNNIFNLFYRASDVFQEFIWDLAKGLKNVKIFAFTDTGAYLRDKANKWEAWSSFRLKKDESGKVFGQVYDVDEAFPRALTSEGIVSGGDLNEQQTTVASTLPRVFWSAERMAPFSVAFQPRNSRIVTRTFLAGNGVGYGVDRPAPSRASKDYLKEMAEYEARTMMRSLKPNYAVSIATIADRLRRGWSKEKALRSDLSESDGVERIIRAERRGNVKERWSRAATPTSTQNTRLSMEHLSREGKNRVKGKESRSNKRKRVMETEEEDGEEMKEREEKKNESEESEREIFKEDTSDSESDEGRRKDTESQSVVSDLEELGLGGGGIPMPEEMRRNLVLSESVVEKGFETKLGVRHSLSAVQYAPKSNKFAVESAGKYLAKALNNPKSFDPFAFQMTKEAKEGEEAREKTLSVDFTLARPPHQLTNEAPMLPTVSKMLAKCYNKFLFIARCMEKGDERAIWMTIKDAIFSTAHNLTRIHDLRVESATGSNLYTSRANMEGGFIREKVKQNVKKNAVKKDSFFRGEGGFGDPPQQTYSNLGQNIINSNLYSSPMEEDDLLVPSSVGDPYFRGSSNRARSLQPSNWFRAQERDRPRPVARGGDRNANAGFSSRQTWRGQRGRGNERGRRGMGRAGGTSSSSSSSGDSWESASSPTEKWGN